MFRKLFLSLFFSLPLYSSQTPSPIGERTLSAPNGQILREIFTESGDANVYICDCSTWPQDENGRIPELNIRLELRSDYRLASYIFQNIPLKATLMDVQNVIMGDQSGRSLCFLHNGTALALAFSLNFYQITSEDLIYAMYVQQYTVIKNDAEKLKKMEVKLRTDWERNKTKVEFARRMSEQDGGMQNQTLTNELLRLRDIRFNLRASKPKSYRKLVHDFTNKMDSENPQIPSGTSILVQKPDEISTESLPTFWD